MADVTKYAPINGGTLITDIKSHFHIFKTKKTVTFAYGFLFAFIAFTIFLAFSPSSNSSSPWFTNIFSISSGGGAFSVSSNPTYDSRGSNSGSVDSAVVSANYTEQVRNTTSVSSPVEEDASGSENSNSGQPNLDKLSPIVNNDSRKADLRDKVGVLEPNRSTVLKPTSSEGINQTVDTKPPKSSPQSNAGSSDFKNQTQSKDLNDKGEILKTNQNTTTAGGASYSQEKANQTGSSVSNSSSSSEKKTVTTKGENRISEKSVVKNLTSSLVRNNHGNGTNSSVSAGQDYENLVKSLLDCDLFDGNWVRDESYPLYMPGSCSLIDEQFNCFVNGRPDNNYHKMKWKPKGCSIPRLDGRRMLEMLRGKRLVFVGDSLNRNMWESLVCILRNSVKDPTKVYEASGKQRFRSEASYSFVFQEFGCTVEFFASPFLVREWEVKDGNNNNNKKKETLRLDMIGETADKYKNADVIVFNTGHWWTHEKTSLGKDYYQEGSHVYSELNVVEAFRKALTTWGRWIDSHINPSKTLVFFRGYSASHFSGGQWNSGGACDHEIEPIKNETYLTPYPSKMVVLERVLRGMKTRVSYLNVTRMTDYRKDGHPSIYRKQSYTDAERRSPLKFQDCSHWCLPGVPDAWNEILYAQLLANQYKKKLQRQNRT